MPWSRVLASHLPHGRQSKEAETVPSPATRDGVCLLSVGLTPPSRARGVCQTQTSPKASKCGPPLRSPTSLPAGPQASVVELCVAAGPHPGPRGRGRRQSSVSSLCQAGSGTAPSHQTCSAGSWVTSGHLSRLSELSACTCEVGEVRAAPRGAVCPARDLGAGRGRHCKTQLCPLRAHRPGRNRQ